MNHALVLHRAVGLDDGAKIGALARALRGEGEKRLVVSELVLVDRRCRRSRRARGEDHLHVGARRRLGQIERHRLRHDHLRDHHEDDEKHERDVDQRRDVDADDSLVDVALLTRQPSASFLLRHDGLQVRHAEMRESTSVLARVDLVSRWNVL